VKERNESKGLKNRYSQKEEFCLSQIEKDRDHEYEMTLSCKKMHAVKTAGEEESPSTHALGGDFPMLVIV